MKHKILIQTFAEAFEILCVNVVQENVHFKMNVQTTLHYKSRLRNTPSFAVLLLSWYFKSLMI